MLPSFLEEAALCISKQNGHRLGGILGISQRNLELVGDCKRARLDPEEDLDTFRLNCLGNRQFSKNDENELWGNVLAGYLRVIMRLADGKKDAAFAEQVILIQTVQRIFLTATRWILPLIYTVNEDLYELSTNEEQSQECGRIVNKTVTICLNDRGGLGESRKWGVYRMTTLLFRIYFRLGQLNLCGNVLRALGNAELPDPTRYPAAQLVAFRYLLGRYYFVSEEFEKAEGELHLSFAHCLTESRNKRLILHFLIPVRLLQGGMRPSNALLKRHGLDNLFYCDALAALWKGDLKKYMDLLTKYEYALLRLGTFLVWEKLLLIGYRNLLRKIYLLLGSTRIPLAQLVRPFKRFAMAMDVDEIACYVANLIERGMIKGYISQEKTTIVLSQKDPFPPLSTAKLFK
jgi:hypothetical protein